MICLMVNDFLNGSNFSSHSLDPLISCWHNFTSRSSANIDSLLLFERNKFVHKKKMSQDTQTKKRNLDEISADSSSIEQADTGGGEPASKEVKPSLEEPEWLSALYQKMKTDKRIGFTKQQPSIPELNHGWLMEANKEVLHALIKPEFKCIIELGSWLGRSANFIAKEAPNAVIFAVDLWENAIFEHDTHYSKCPMFLEILNNGPIHQQFMRNTWADRFPRAPTAFDSASSSTSNSTTYSTPTGIVPMRMDSCAALRILKEIGVTPDLIYVDANHHYKPVLDDVSLSVELFPDALIVGDDWHYEEVQRAVREVGDKHGREVYVRGAHCWTYSKRECEAIFTSNWKSSQQAQQTTTPKNDEKKPKTTSTEKKPISLPANANFADLMKAYGSRN